MLTPPIENLPQLLEHGWPLRRQHSRSFFWSVDGLSLHIAKMPGSRMMMTNAAITDRLERRFPRLLRAKPMHRWPGVSAQLDETPRVSAFRPPRYFCLAFISRRRFERYDYLAPHEASGSPPPFQKRRAAGGALPRIYYMIELHGSLLNAATGRSSRRSIFSICCRHFHSLAAAVDSRT